MHYTWHGNAKFIVNMTTKARATNKLLLKKDNLIDL